MVYLLFFLTLFVVSISLEGFEILSLVLFLMFGAFVCQRYWQLRLVGVINNSYTNIVCYVSFVPFIYMIMMLIFESILPDLYFGYATYMSGFSEVVAYVAPGIDKTIDGLYRIGAVGRAIDVGHKYSVVYSLGLIGACLCVVHGAYCSKKELEWVDSQPAETFSPELRYVMYFASLMMILCVIVLSSVDASDLCDRGRCWSTRYSDFPVMYLIPQLEIIAGLFVGAVIRRDLNWKRKQGEMNV